MAAEILFIYDIVDTYVAFMRKTNSYSYLLDKISPVF